MRSINLATALLVTLGVSAAAESQVASAAGLPIQAVVPVRLADTRTGEKTVDGLYAGMGVRSARSSSEIKIAGRGGVPTDAKAVMLNLTDVQWLNPTTPLEDNFLTVYPCTATPPQASNLNSPKADVRANNVFVKLSNTGTVCVYSEKASHFVIDVNGYVPAGGATESVNPARLFDGRPGEKTIDGKFVGGGKVAAESTTKVQIAGRGGVPANARAAIINVTDVLPSDGNLLKVHPCNDPLPTASSVNTPAGDIRANNLYVELNHEGAVCVYSVKVTNFIIDVNGYVLDGGSPGTLTIPTRLFDSRPGEKTVDGKYAGAGRVGPNSVTEIQIAGRGGVPGSATVAVLNLTSIFPQTGNYLTAYPCGSARPSTSNVNSPTGDIRANGVVVKLSSTGTVCVYSVYATDFLIDASGYSVTPPVPLRVLNAGCGEEGNAPLTAVEYTDESLNGKGAIGPRVYRTQSGWLGDYSWPESSQNFEVVGGLPPYTFEASGLVGYNLDTQTGSLTRVSGSSGTVAFTLNITDSAGTKMSLPAKATWAPTTYLQSYYQSLLPGGEKIPGPTFTNWGKAPFTYSWSGASGVTINPTSGELTRTATAVGSVQGIVTVTDGAGATNSVKVNVETVNGWPVNLPSGTSISAGAPIAQFNTNGWGSAPYSYELSGTEAPGFAMSSSGQLSVTDPALVQTINTVLLDAKAGGTRAFDLTVKDSRGNKITLKVGLNFGRRFTLPFLC